MGFFKYVLQIIAALLYTGIYAMLAYAIAVLPTAWILSLNWWQMLLILFIAGSFIEAVIQALIGVVTLPFVWIVNRNIVATIWCVLSFIVNGIGFIMNIWQIEHSGVWHFISLLIISIIIAQIFITAIYFVVCRYLETKVNDDY